MMKITNTDVYGFEHAIRACRNPMNSWDKSDSGIYVGNHGKYTIGEKDQELSRKLTKAGSEHCKHLRTIQVWMDIEAPRYWWQEMDTYRHVEKISCSTMHKLFERELTLDDFEIGDSYIERNVALNVIEHINSMRKLRLKNDSRHDKEGLLIMAKNILPESFLQKRTINTNYQQLLNMYRQRKGHKLPQWRAFCKWVLELPYFRELTDIE